MRVNVFVAGSLHWVWVNPRVLQANFWLKVMLGSPVTPQCPNQDRVQIQPFELTLGLHMSVLKSTS